ncbi:IgGFc-binding protein-like isoform X7 [Crotalus tigris]|uniref:IgGFc-binding protein-like isoform X7 n=1 Tax=Crotalus tigris TaxID=88082 RepID=UPI00192F795E|nr:IgGFc-binding protein-like isoform X7 [Crotalus tigris]
MLPSIMGTRWCLLGTWVFLFFAVHESRGREGGNWAAGLESWTRDTDYLASCDFNNNSWPFCDWTQTCGTNQGTWIRTKHDTPTPDTGPSGDYPDGRGYFIYQEASNLVPYDLNRLESPQLMASGEVCIDFRYHMFGAEDFNELHVTLLWEGSEMVVWSQIGSQGPEWQHGLASVYLEKETRFKVAFDAIRGLTEYGDTAVDNVAVRRGPCTWISTTTESTTTQTPPHTPESCLVSGDPHYYTFDKQTHHFMGNCTYTLSQLCDRNNSLLPYFNVEASNEHRGGNTHVSYVESVDVDVFGIRINLGKGGRVTVDGEPVVVPSIPIRGVKILPSGFYTVVSTDFGLRVKFDGDHQVEVSLLSTYKGEVCGMCGNYNGDPFDDFLNPDGEQEPDSTSLGNSWQVANLSSCSSGHTPTCTEDEKDTAKSSDFCGRLMDVNGPFRQCHSVLDPTGYFESCLYDQCALHLDPGSLCRSLQSYADACQSLGVAIDPWRNATFCPIHCKPNSHYEPCANACPSTCKNPSAPGTCNLTCTEACVCDSGFFLYNGTCVPSHQCGCWHQGKHYPVGSGYWTDDTCSTRCACPSQGGQLSCFPDSCPHHYYCGVENGVPNCYKHTYGVCRIHNDPHYNTFDKKTHHFMGTCTYTLAKVCSNETGLPYFNVEAKNEHRGNPSVSYVQRVLVEVYGQRIEILKGHKNQVLVNKVLTRLSVRKLKNTLRVDINGRYVTLETDFGLIVSYDTDHSVEIRVPTNFFNKTCGMCGNFNNRWQDDNMMPNGEQAKNSNELGNSWQVPNAEYDPPNCKGPQEPEPCPSDLKNLYKSEAYCGQLTSSQGPLAACHSAINPNSFFQSCIFDLCELNGSHEALCSALEAYADACQRVGLLLLDWRNATSCKIPCDDHSHYNVCATSCPATCSNPLAPWNCTKPCVEGCECDEGFVFSGAQCVPREDCGCVDGDQYYEKGETFWQPDCVGRCRCAENGTLLCTSDRCRKDQVCKVQNGILGCHIADKAICHIYGDPHYVTFDGRLYHFQGGCNYTAVQICSNSSEQFSVTTRNEHRSSPHWTALNSVAISLRNIHLALRKNKEVYVNGAKVDLPLRLQPDIQVEEQFPYVVVDSPLGFRVKFDGDHQLFIEVSERYKGHLCGLCGTYSGSQLDDFQQPDGMLETDANKFGNSWRVEDDAWSCSPVVPTPCDPVQEAVFEDLCEVILSSNGPFTECHGSIPPQLYFESCVYDLCATGGDKEQLCNSLEAYAAACEVNGADLGDWKKDTVCGPPCGFSCSFEKDFCSWSQSSTDSFDWRRHKGPTPSPNTGPFFDHTTGGGYFIYLDGSDANPGDVAHLISSTCDLRGPLCFRFWYHMYGVAQTMALRFYVILDDASPLLVWSETGNKGNIWQSAQFSVVHNGRVKILLEGMRGDDFRSDMAVDDISVQDGYCPPWPSIPPESTPTLRPPPPTQESCLVSGDPHYYTFDKQTHHFMGNCTYTLSQLCNPNNSLLPYFNVEASNEHRGGNTHVSYVESVDVDVFGIRINLGKGGRVTVDGEPVVVPSIPIRGVKILPSGFYTVVSTDFGLRVKFDGDHQVEVSLLSTYEGEVCGMCGNYNGDPSDDFLNPDGEQEPDSTSLGNSWQVANLSSCSSGHTPICTEDEKDTAKSSDFCGRLMDVNGPFRQCHSVLDPTGYFESCLYDQCALHLDPGSLCRSLQSYADACQSLGVAIDPWRNITFCPIHCKPNSHYEPCANACPSSCKDPNAPGTCNLPCTEACVCDSGFFLYNGTCVPSHQCGCWHQGKHYPVGSSYWTDDTCSTRCICPSQGGQLSCFPDFCPHHYYCGVENGVPNCYKHTYGVCRIHNDPHYNTFDKKTHHFMGTCTYTLAKVCSNETGLPYFNVEAKNEHRGNPSVSYVQRVLVEVYGQRIEILKGHKNQVLVNKVLTRLSVRKLNNALRVDINGRYVTLETDFGLIVSYDTDHSVEIRVPTNFFNKTCGMCGNFNNRWQDDNMMPNGEQAKNSNELGNSWQVPNAEYDPPNCKGPPEPETCPSDLKNLYESEAYCGQLTSSQGPLAACHSAINPNSFFQSCIFDLCELNGSHEALCSALEAYADACQRVGLLLPDWRNATSCKIPCDDHSHYNVCATSCPATCSNPLAPWNCTKPCVEGCECDEGFVFSGAQCVPQEDCGCVDGDQYYEKGETFWKPDCVGRCRCAENGTLSCTSDSCKKDQVCKVQNGILGCYIADKATCHIYGDPHYVTFDGRLYHFQGGCNYTAVQICSNSSEQFSVTTRNEHRSSPHWTALNSVAISLRNIHVALRKNKEVYVNGAKVDLPLRLQPNIQVEEQLPYVVVDSNIGFRVKFDGDHQLFIEVSERYKGHLCGLCGTYSGSQLDDFQQPDGMLETDANKFGNSWRVEDDAWSCSPVVPTPCDPVQEAVFEDLCEVILSSNGPFTECHGSIPPQLYFESCVYDQCATGGDKEQLCNSLEAYAAACEVNGADLGDWKKDTVCEPKPTPTPVEPSTPEPTPSSEESTVSERSPSPVEPTDSEPTPSPVEPPVSEPTPSPIEPTVPEPTPSPIEPTVPESTPSPVEPTDSEPTPSPVEPTNSEPTPSPVEPPVSESTPSPVEPPVSGSTMTPETTTLTDDTSTTPISTTTHTPIVLTQESCLVSGDPHYYTFDKQTHHFMGNCTYTLSQLCDRNNSLLPYFNVEASNEHRGGNTHVSYVESVDVDVFGIRINLGKGGRVTVDREPVMVPSIPIRGVKILPSGFYTVVSTDFGLRVKFDGDHQVEVSLLNTYKGEVCGMCGNYNGNTSDDFLNPDGELEPDSTSLGNSWQVANLSSCSSGHTPVCTEDEKDTAKSSNFCGRLMDVNGPFRQCHSVLDPTGYFESCLYDQCALHLDPGSLCRSLQSYADACQSLGVAIDPWRNTTFCPIHCKPNSHYEPCANACPSTCKDPNAPGTCNLPCTEACVCDSGFFLYNGTCVPSHQCGCWHQGKHYPVGSGYWTDDTCSTRCVCPGQGDQLSCFPDSCPEHYYCGVKNGVPDCYEHTYGVCRIHNDPHYNTFDKKTHHFMGTCTYTLAKVCSNETGLPYFNVEAKNEHRGNPSVSYVQRVLVEVYGQRIEILKGHKNQVLVNKVLTRLSVRKLKNTLRVDINGRYVTLETDFGLIVSYDTDHSVEIRVPTNFFNKTCGMCGNFNNRWQDDNMMPNGEQAKNSNELGNSWQVPNAEYDPPNCKGPQEPEPCPSDLKNLYESEAYCGQLTSSQGPLAACHSAINPNSFFQSCIFDLCELNGSHEALCSALEAYADACQRVGLLLPDWRNATSCKIPCDDHSHYNVCATSCPATCSNPLAPWNCTKPCVEGCECDEGFVFSGAQCVPQEDCGCVDGDQYYEKGETFWKPDCVGRCRCAENGTLSCTSDSCKKDQVCKVQNGILGCYIADKATCHIYGDPHYVTFDGRLYHFQGGCNYTAVQICSNSSEQFSVTTRNEHRSSPHWTALNSVAISLRNIHLALRTNKEVYVNGAKVDLPLRLQPNIQVEEQLPYVVVDSNIGFRVKFDGDHQLFIEVSERYKGHLCGLCGTYSGSQLDDFQQPDGMLETDANKFGNSWRVEDDAWSCSPVVPAPCDPLKEAVFEDLCKIILSSNGPFTECHGSIPPQLYFESCVYDQCATGGDKEQLCKSLEAYAAACEVNGADLGDWKKDTVCEPTPTPPEPSTSGSTMTPETTTLTDDTSTTPISTTTHTPIVLTQESCLVSGDPHYYTFDKQTHHFMGNCTYTLSQLCDRNNSLLPYFNVEASNEHRGGNTHVSYVESLDVDVFGIRINLGKGGRVTVDGKPVVVPSIPIPGVTILSSGFYTVVSTDFGLRVKFDGDHQVEVSLLSTYKGEVCGMCGNYNGNTSDDFLNPDGELEPDSTSLGNSWQVANLSSCSSGHTPICTEDEKDTAKSSDFCGRLMDVNGPFRQCHSILDPTGYFESCLYDQCALHLDPGSLCRSLQSYADACQSLGVAIDPWRNTTFCPIHCKPNSHYEPCANACPSTCKDPNAPGTCNLPCTEACVCDSGFFLYNGTCVPSHQCGCWHQGKHYPVGSGYWTDDTCSTRCVCPGQGDQLSCFPDSCPEHYYCGVKNGVPDCYEHTYGVCRIHNDPHYNTFDKKTHHFMGTCTYTLAKVCSNETGLPYFNVEAKNEHRGNPSVSYVQRVLVEVYGQRIEILKGHKTQVLVNKVLTRLSVRKLNNTLRVDINGRYVTLETDFGLIVSYDTDHSVEIRVPTDFFSKTCGMCGNFNNRWQDDNMMPNGQQAKNSNELGNSWQVPNAEYDPPNCKGPSDPEPCPSDLKNLYESEAYCGQLTSSQGPLAACHSAINPNSFFQSCIFDLCELNGSHEALCSALEAYADACQRVGLLLPDWRNATSCKIPCDDHSHYNVCATSCPATCSNPLAPWNCTKPCVEGCECDEGFVFSGAQCVPQEDCGCVDGDQYYEKGETFWKPDCVGRCRCAENGTLSCTSDSCKKDQVCKVQNGILGCHIADKAICHIYGDPHYVTFDGRLYHFQGGCNYTAVQICSNSSEQFSVTTRNEHRSSPHWTALNSVAISLRNIHLALRKNKEVYVNGAKVDLPLRLQPNIQVEEQLPYVVVDSNLGFRVKFDGDHQLFIEVSERYKGHLCGLCGTYSGSQLDDFQQPDGMLETDANKFGNSWRVEDDAWSCSPVVPAPCDPLKEAVFEDLCKIILSSNGPFTECHGSIPPQLYFESCVYDQCATGGDKEQLCKSLEAYAAACEVNGADLGDWKKDTVCEPTPTPPEPSTSEPTPSPVEPPVSGSTMTPETTTLTDDTSTTPISTTTHTPIVLTQESCLVSGDPHYYTFDKQTHHFMGNCTYTLSQLCDRNNSLLPYFNVEASNEHRGGNTHVSYVESLDVDVFGIRINLGKGGRVTVDGKPVVVPSIPIPGVTILSSGFYTVVSTDFGLRVKFDGDHQVEVSLLSTYKGEVCGMCGNYNGNTSDDFLNPDGELEPDSTSLGNSWQVANLSSCSSGHTPICTEDEKDTAKSSDFCGRLMDVNGPFRQCHSILDPTGYFESCLYDQCALHLDPGSLCRSLQSYADACQSLGVAIDPWRNTTFCPIHCKPNSHYEPCANACPSTCKDPNALGTCNLPCTEACVCDSGFFLYNGTCVPSHQCGCWHQGKHYPVGSGYWTDDTCSTRCVCPGQGDQLSCFPDSCPEHYYCGVKNGVPDCYEHTYGVCRIHNDPHYNTFDKKTHHFMGTCTYTLAKVCSNETGLPYINVEAKNEHRGNPSVSYVQRVLVEVYGQRIEILKGHKTQVLVNKVLTRLSVRKLNNTLRVDINGRYVTLETDFGLIVSYDTDHSVEIRVPTDFFSKTCGMCGNFNNRWQDDNMMPNGQQAKNSNELGNSWQVPNAEYDPPNCKGPSDPEPCPSDLKNLYESEAYCGQLTSSQGPLAACHSAINPNSFFQSCIFDLCELNGSHEALCSALEAYADACQRVGLQLPDWRNATSCKIPCDDHSHYNVCATSCPATCSNPLAPWNCTKPCVEGCECDEGFVFSGAQCVPQEDCGCVDGDQYYEKGETFWKPDCVGRCRCAENGTLSCTSDSCKKDQVCKVQNGILGCYIADKATCHIYGDPHYVTFDGRLYHFQGGCNYTAVQICSNSSEQFSVTTRNEHRSSPHWTALNSVAISLRNIHLALRKNKEVYVNGAKVDLPLRLQPNIQVEEQLPYVVVDSNIGFRVKFDGDHQLFIEVSERYKGHLCGLCGTYSGSQLDDFQQPDGMLETDANKFGNSWRVEDDAWSCSPVVPAPCDPLKEAVFEDLCKIILSSNGPFTECHGSIPPQLDFESCVYDQCATGGDKEQLCKSLEAYAAACEVNGADLGDWKKDTVCEPTPTPPEPSTSEPTPSPTEPTVPEPTSPVDPTVSVPSICTASGDPHYTTFDGRVHHFMGNCTYTLAKVCTNSTRDLEAFDVSTTNEHRGSNLAVSYVNSVHVAVYGNQVSLLKNRKVNVNGTRRNLPVYIGGNKIVVRLSGSYVILKTNFGLSVRFDGNQFAEVAVPPKYQGLLCGLCGNFNGNPEDDNLKPDGLPAGDSTQLGNSWLVSDNSSICSGPSELCDPKLEEEIRRNSACRLIADPTGPFGQCHAVVDPTHFLENCVYDVCLTQGQQTSVCHGLQAYAASCSNAGVCVEWRNSTLCPISCSVNSHYSSCGTSCPSSCIKPGGLALCSPLPVEGCFCNEGFVLSGDMCVPESDCGCVDDQDNYYQLGETWFVDESCKERCTCRPNNEINCTLWQCGVQENCAVQDGVLGCYTKGRASCHVVGDPHYYTFDKVMHTFLGTCLYTLVAACDTKNLCTVTPFNITGKNEDRGLPGATYLREVHVDVYDLRITLQKDKKILLNKMRAYTPVESRSQRNSVTVSNVGNYMVVETDFGLTVKYDGNQYLEISLPSSYFSQVRGLCGNYNGQKEDELLMPNGSQAKNVTQFGNSWKVDDYEDSSCLPDTRPELGPPCTPGDLSSVEKQCQVLHSGVFVPCHPLVQPDLFVQTCVYDMCKYDGMRATLCAVVQAYADACQAKGVPIQWRNTTFCPLPCPPNSFYAPCAPPCPPTCSNIYAGELCEKPPGGCLEGCVCNEGFVLSDDQCVPLSQCGCQDKDGRYHKIGESWLTPHCSQKCRCRRGGTIRCQDFGCDPGEVCDTRKDGKLHCKPTGFGNCLITGDPHYMTFDGLLHHFQGLRTYVLSQTIPDASERLEPFSIEGTNRAVVGVGQPSVLKELLIRVYNHTVLFKQRKKLVVDGVATVPPARPHEGLRIQQSGRQIFLQSDFGLSVAFDGSENSGILLPNSYKRNVEGLCGNFDGRYRNDFAKPDGTLVKDVNTFGQSWRVPVKRASFRLRRDLVSEEALEDAELDVGFSPLCSEEALKVFNSSSVCGVLLDPRGPFPGCWAHEPPNSFLQSCLFDMCREDNRTARLCPILEQYALACQSKNVPVANWRAATGCAPQCSPHSHYNPCMSACPPSCSDLAAPANCDSPCLEGCECDSGYVLSGFDCVPFRDCGCSFLGKYYQVGDRFMVDDCSQDCVCLDSSSLSCNQTGCAQDYRCRTFNLTRGCFRADPCQPNSCFNNGTCVRDDSPDTFHCECPDNYDGLLCEIQVTPGADPCQPNPCLNAGTCVRDNSSEAFRCECPEKYQGKLCENERTDVWLPLYIALGVAAGAILLAVVISVIVCSCNRRKRSPPPRSRNRNFGYLSNPAFERD